MDFQIEGLRLCISISKPEKLNLSKAAANISKWFIAIVEFARVSEIIESMIQAEKVVQEKLNDLQEKFVVKQKLLQEVEDAIATVQIKFDAKIKESAETETKIVQTGRRITNAKRLKVVLDKGVRWNVPAILGQSQMKFGLGYLIASAT
ncbi:MAG: hypothetical protein EZS28_046730 [Streblomastix strix]|uniref:Uncharacterized protein n=1 Tax=Streblomastix strix TaxID=222440 RepID=A0A5J4TJ30_9EUKA|nr:MAG: hypothetical protein EZS28_046730 [Streblomastix strix]